MVYFAADDGDKEIFLDRSNFVVWAFGQLDSNNEPAFHTHYPKSDIIIDFNTTEPVNDCFSFTKRMEAPVQLWERTRITDAYVVIRINLSVCNCNCYSHASTEPFERLMHIWDPQEEYVVIRD